LTKAANALRTLNIRH